MHSADNFNSIISAELSDPITYLLVYETVASILYSILNLTAFYIKDDIYQKYYSKMF